MPTSAGPNTFGEENLVFGYDLGNFPYSWGVTQLLTDSEFTSQTSPLTFASAFTNANYLGQYSNGLLTGTSLIFSGGDGANYSVSQPALWGWNRGNISSTGGNWVYANILPSVSQSAVDYVVECKWRFNYIALTGNGTTNPTFQIGRAYTPFFERSFSDTGNSYDWQYTKFGFNGAHAGFNTSTQFVLGLNSADSAVEVDYLRVYRIEKATGLKDLTGNSTIDLTNVSFDSNAQMTFDGTNDLITLADAAHLKFSNGSFTVEQVLTVNSISSKQRTFSKGSSGWSRGWHAAIRPTQWEFELSDGVSSPGNSFKIDTTTTVGTNHVVWAVENGATVKLYVNGTQVGSTQTITEGINFATTTSTVGIGAFESGGEYFNGKIPYTKLYSRALTASEIRSNFNAVKSRFGI
jgi:hypothetical protein